MKEATDQLRSILRGWAVRWVLLGWAAFGGTPGAMASWETGARAGFDSNVNLSVNDEESDSFLTAHLSFFREPSGDSRWDWTFDSTAEGSVYFRVNDLTSASITISPGVTFVPSRTWNFKISPFLQAKGVKDSEQSALAWGGRVGLTQQLSRRIYAGQYYVYKDSRADVDTYSFTEHVVGAFLGVSWSGSVFSEGGYEYSHGDSFRTLSTTSTAVSGKGRHRRYSETFGADVIREKVDCHVLGATLGIDWSRSFFSSLSYAFSILDGDLGTSQSHGGSVGIGYRF